MTTTIILFNQGFKKIIISLIKPKLAQSANAPCHVSMSNRNNAGDDDDDDDDDNDKTTISCSASNYSIICSVYISVVLQLLRGQLH